MGKASGVYSALRQLGGAFGVATVVAVFTASGGYASARAFVDGFGPAMTTCALLAVGGTLAGLAVPGHGARDTVTGRLTLLKRPSSHVDERTR